MNFHPILHSDDLEGILTLKMPIQYLRHMLEREEDRREGKREGEGKNREREDVYWNGCLTVFSCAIYSVSSKERKLWLYVRHVKVLSFCCLLNITHFPKWYPLGRKVTMWALSCVWKSEDTETIKFCFNPVAAHAS